MGNNLYSVLKNSKNPNYLKMVNDELKLASSFIDRIWTVILLSVSCKMVLIC